MGYFRRERIHKARFRIVGGDAFSVSYNQPITRLTHKLITVVNHGDGFLIHADHIVLARHIHAAADSNGIGRIEIIRFVFHETPVNKQLSIQRSHHQMVFAIHTQGPHDIISVGQAMIGKAAVEETVQTLVSGYPKAAPLVDKYVFDQVKARGQFPYLFSVVLIEGMRIGQDHGSVPLVLASGNNTVVRCLKVEGGLQGNVLVADSVDAILGKGQQRRS